MSDTSETTASSTDSSETNPSETNPPEEPATAVEAVDAPPAVVQPPQAPAVVVFQGVVARDAAGPRHRPRGTLNGVSLSLGTGAYAFVGAPEDGTLALLDVLTGTRAPVHGRITVGGLSPARAGALRSRMGTLLPEPLLPSARTVDEVVSIAQVARGQTQARSSDVLAPLGLDFLAARHPRSLSFAEARALELALALSTPSPLLVVLHEPLADVAVNLLGLVRERVRLLAASGACVVVTTSSPADARALADSVFVLHRGLVAPEGAANASFQASPLLVAWVRPGESGTGMAPIRLLARALAQRPELTSVTWTDSPTSSQACELRLSGTDLDACALALADAAEEVGAVIEAITPASPGLTRLRAAAEAADALRRAVVDPRPPSLRAPTPGVAR